MDREKEALYRQQITDALEMIGWRLVHKGCDHWQFVDQHGTFQPIKFFCDRIEYDEKDKNFGFGLNCSNMEIDFYPNHDKWATHPIGVGFRDKCTTRMYINCYNFDK